MANKFAFFTVFWGSLRQELKKFLQVKRDYSLAPEFGGLLLLALGSALLLSLFSYNHQDNALIIFEDNFHNLLGFLGARSAQGLFSLLGLWALMVPLSSFYFSLRLIFALPAFFTRERLLGLWLLMWGLGPIIAYFFPKKPESAWALGGKIGEAFAKFIAAYAGLWGLIIVCLTILASGLLLLLQRPYLARCYFTLRGLLVRPSKPKVLPVVDFPAPKPKSTAPLLIKPPQFVAGEEPAAQVKPESKQKLEPVQPEVSEGEIAIIQRDRDRGLSALKKAEAEGGLAKSFSFALPPIKLLDYDAPSVAPVDQLQLKQQAEKLKRAFLQFGIEGTIREIRPGPVVTNFEFVPAPGIKLSRISALSDDIAMAMFATQVRIVTPIPGKGAVGIEVPNARRETVYLKEIVADENYRKESHKLSMAVGKDVEGTPYFINLADMPHVLIAGTTGSGKSVSVNAMICSILYRATPRDVRFIMIDPKMLELSIYNGIPHLLLPPIIDAKKAGNALRWAVKEMDQRYGLMKEVGVRDIASYNIKINASDTQELNPVDGRKHEHMPYLVIVVDEYADLLAVAGKEVEGHIMRLAQKARACGIHVMLATQRPSVDVITGVIKANFPVRMGFRLASSHDSKTIINKTGAEKLLGRGDLLIMPPGSSDVFRVHGAYVSEKELARVVSFWQEQKAPEYQEEIAEFEENSCDENATSSDKAALDEKFEEALAIVRQHNKCSTSFLQRQLAIGYNRSARIVEHMEKVGIVGPVLNARGEREIF
jgi:S-DNA-T family DNA segregation ATPase FtsK/SpoIIIE